MKEYYSWLEDGQKEHNSSAHQQKSQQQFHEESFKQKSEESSVHDEMRGLHMFTKHVPDSRQSSKQVDYTADFSKSKLYDSGDVDIENDFRVSVHNDTDVRDDGFEDTQQEEELVKNLKFESMSQTSIPQKFQKTQTIQTSNQQIYNIDNLMLSNHVIQKTMVESERQSLAPSFGAMNFDKNSNKLVFLQNSNRQMMQNSIQNSLNLTNEDKNIEIFNVQPQKKDGFYQTLGIEEKLVSTQPSQLFISSREDTSCKKSSHMNDSETKQQQIGKGLFGRRTMEETDFQLIESESYMPPYLQSKKKQNPHPMKEDSQSSRVQPLEVSIQNSFSKKYNPVESSIQSSDQSSSIHVSEVNLDHLESQKMSNLFIKIEKETHTEIEVLNQESVNILQEMTETTTTIGMDQTDNTQPLNLITNWRNVTPSPKISRARNMGYIVEQKKLVESNKENLKNKDSSISQNVQENVVQTPVRVKNETRRVVQNHQPSGLEESNQSLHRSLSSQILAEKYNKTSSGEIDTNPEAFLMLKTPPKGTPLPPPNPQNPYMIEQQEDNLNYLESKVKDSENTANPMNLFDVSNIAYYSSNNHHHSPLNLQKENVADKPRREEELDTLIPARTVQNSEMKSNQTIEKSIMNQDLVETERRKSTNPGGNLSILQNLREQSSMQGTAEQEFLALESLQEKIFDDQEAEMDKLVGEYQKEIKEVREMSLRALTPF